MGMGGPGMGGPMGMGMGMRPPFPGGGPMGGGPMGGMGGPPFGPPGQWHVPLLLPGLGCASSHSRPAQSMHCSITPHCLFAIPPSCTAPLTAEAGHLAP